jgi:hypothetical protein
MGNALKTKTEEVCFATGPAVKLHELVAIMREKERAGELKVIGPARAVPLFPHLIAMPYILAAPRSKPLLTRKRLLAGAVGVYVLTVAALAWEARYILLAAAGVVMLVMALLWLRSLFGGGAACSCVIHGPGCTG